MVETSSIQRCSSILLREGIDMPSREGTNLSLVTVTEVVVSGAGGCLRAERSRMRAKALKRRNELHPTHEAFTLLDIITCVVSFLDPGLQMSQPNPNISIAAYRVLANVRGVNKMWQEAVVVLLSVIHRQGAVRRRWERIQQWSRPAGRRAKTVLADEPTNLLAVTYLSDQVRQNTKQWQVFINKMDSRSNVLLGPLCFVERYVYSAPTDVVSQKITLYLRVRRHPVFPKWTVYIETKCLVITDPVEVSISLDIKNAKTEKRMLVSKKVRLYPNGIREIVVFDNRRTGPLGLLKGERKLRMYAFVSPDTETWKRVCAVMGISDMWENEAWQALA